MGADPPQRQLKQRTLQLLELVDLMHAHLSITLWRAVLGITEDFQKKFEVKYSALHKGFSQANAVKIKSWQREKHYHHTFN